jgi:hypothetical protein
MYIHYNHVQSTKNPAKIVKKYGLFQFEEDANTTPWHVSSPFNLNPTTKPLQKFKDNLPKSFGSGTISINEHLVAFSNACHNIGVNDNETCMRLFVKYLEGNFVVDLFELPPKVFLTWDKLYY